MKLSVIIITKNEAANIAKCLKSVDFADEFIVVDSGSTDARSSSRAGRARVTSDWPGFGPQKNRAVDLATGDWVLSIDADELVTPELAREIQERSGRAAMSKCRACPISAAATSATAVVARLRGAPVQARHGALNDAYVHERVVPNDGKRPLQLRAISTISPMTRWTR